MGVYGTLTFGLAWAFPTARGMEKMVWRDGFDCPFDQIVALLRGSIGVGGVNQRVDPGQIHGCIPGKDPVDLNAEMMEKTNRQDKNGNYPPDRDYVGPGADCMCIFIIALHRMVYEEGVAYDDLYDMDEFHFLKFQDKLGQMEFQGVTGPLKYVYQGDPQTTVEFPNGLPGPDPDGMTNVW